MEIWRYLLEIERYAHGNSHRIWWNIPSRYPIHILSILSIMKIDVRSIKTTGVISSFHPPKWMSQSSNYRTHSMRMGQNFWEDNNILISSELNPSPGHFWVAIDVHCHVLMLAFSTANGWIPSGKRLQFAIENGDLVVDLPIHQDSTRLSPHLLDPGRSHAGADRQPHQDNFPGHISSKYFPHLANAHGLGVAQPKFAALAGTSFKHSISFRESLSRPSAKKWNSASRVPSFLIVPSMSLFWFWDVLGTFHQRSHAPWWVALALPKSGWQENSTMLYIESSEWSSGFQPAVLGFLPIFHRFVNVYQRVWSTFFLGWSMANPKKLLQPLLNPLARCFSVASCIGHHTKREWHHVASENLGQAFDGCM